MACQVNSIAVDKRLLDCFGGQSGSIIFSCAKAISWRSAMRKRLSKSVFLNPTRILNRFSCDPPRIMSRVDSMRQTEQRSNKLPGIICGAALHTAPRGIVDARTHLRSSGASPVERVEVCGRLKAQQVGEFDGDVLAVIHEAGAAWREDGIDRGETRTRGTPYRKKSRSRSAHSAPRGPLRLLYRGPIHREVLPKHLDKFRVSGPQSTQAWLRLFVSRPFKRW